jgi:hypothetical protein
VAHLTFGIMGAEQDHHTREEWRSRLTQIAMPRSHRRREKRDGGGMVIARTEIQRGRSTDDARGGAQQGVRM